MDWFTVPVATVAVVVVFCYLQVFYVTSGFSGTTPSPYVFSSFLFVYVYFMSADRV